LPRTPSPQASSARAPRLSAAGWRSRVCLSRPDLRGQLWGADTVVERLDDASFDANGVASTRLQMRALSLVSIAPIKTACGDFHAYVSLGGKQRVTTMNIYRTQEGGGNFVAPLAVNARVTFIPVKPAGTKAARKLALDGSFTFPAGSPIPWSLKSDAGAKRTGSVMVCTPVPAP
jgi:hypothetical protein